MSETPTFRRDVLRLAAAVLVFAATLAIAVPVVTARLARPKATEPTQVILAPTGSDGITVIPGAGRVLFVDSNPAGAKVTVSGKPVGATPWSSDWSCVDGEAVQIVVERAGSLPHTTVVACQQGTTRIAVTLEAAKR
ncbi:MAG: PEGA domain-containing protein [Myxococcaceae bacterium]|nr:PEGA domain-containing protein [Myxococcaceae bacterium]